MRSDLEQRIDARIVVMLEVFVWVQLGCAV
jgi:hypothetical protein